MYLCDGGQRLGRPLGVWKVGSSIGGALGPGEAILVSDGHHQPAGRQLTKPSWTWRLSSNCPLTIQSFFLASIILNSPTIRLKSLETFLTSSWRSPCCVSYSPSKFLRIWTGPHSGCRLPCDLPAHLLRRHRCHLLPRAQGRLDQLQVLIRKINIYHLMDATATSPHSHNKINIYQKPFYGC